MLFLGVGRINKKLGLIPVAVIAILIVVMLLLGMRGQYVFNPPYLVLIVGLIFVTGVGLVVAYLSIKSYLATGSTVLLIMSMAFVVQSIVPIGSGVVATFSPSATVAIATLGLIVGSVVQMFAAIQASFRSAPIGAEHRKSRLASACLLMLFLSLLVILLPFYPGFPVLFVNAAGVTSLNDAFYALSIIVFLVGSSLFMRLYVQSKSSALYWYSLALLLWGVGTFGVAFQLRFSDIIAWTGRSGWYTGSLYYLVALRSASVENKQD